MKISQKAGLENVRGLLMYQAVAEVASAALGDGKKKGSAPSFDPSDQPEDFEDAVKRFERIMGGGKRG